MIGVLRVLVAALVVVFLGLTAWLFVFPDQDNPTSADAVVVLSGARTPRLDKGLDLMRQKVAPTLVISDAPARGWPEANRLCAGKAAFKVICFKPEPYSTRGEAEEIGRLVKRHRWKRVVVVTSRFHVTRARMLVERCVKNADVDAVGAHVPLFEWPRDIVFEWGKLILAETFRRGC